MNRESAKIMLTESSAMIDLQSLPPELREGLTERESRWLAEGIRNELDLEPVLKELEAAGYVLPHIEALNLRNAEHAEAFPIVLNWLFRTDNPSIKFLLASLLDRDPRVRGHVMAIFEELSRTTHALAAAGLAKIVRRCAPRTMAEALIAYVEDRSRPAIARSLLAGALPRFPRHRGRVIPLLMNLLEEEQEPLLLTEAIHGLRKLDLREALGVIERFCLHKSPGLRKAARETVIRFGGEPPAIPARKRYLPFRIPKSYRGVSATVKLESAASVLASASGAIEAGFAAEQMDEVLRLLDALVIYQRGKIRFPICFDGRLSSVIVLLNVLDTMFVEVTFVATPPLAQRIEEQLNKYLGSELAG